MTYSMTYLLIGSVFRNSKDVVVDKTSKGKVSGKENKESGTYKQSAYFHPNKIITEF